MSADNQFDPQELRKFIQNKFGSGIKVEVVPQTQPEETEDGGTSAKDEKVLEFDFKPSEIKQYLDRFVIKQDDAKKVLATAICDHYHHLQNIKDPDDWRDYKKQNIILIGPTGVGKTYLIQNIARLIGVPFVKADATKYSETGYVGGDVEDLVRELVAQADNDVALAECGIIYLDEIDKLASQGGVLGRDVSGQGVQRNLLKLMEETEVPLRSSTDIASQMQAFMELQTRGKTKKQTINTRHILFIVSGAFSGLPEIIKKRIGSKQIGFTGEKVKADQEHLIFEKVKAVDFIAYGFEAEFAGRLPVTVHCTPLGEEELFDILKNSEGSILKQYKRDFLAYGIDVYFTDSGMRAIAENAVEEETGARGLMSVCEKTFREFKYRLPDSEVKEFVVTDELVNDPLGTLDRLMEKPDMFSGYIQAGKLHKVEAHLEEIYGVAIRFTPEASQALVQRASAAGEDCASFCENLLKEYEHALNLLSKASRKSEYIIDDKGLLDLGGTFERFIRDGYHESD